jgi:hypothetical protein
MTFLKDSATSEKLIAELEETSPVPELWLSSEMHITGSLSIPHKIEEALGAGVLFAIPTLRNYGSVSNVSIIILLLVILMVAGVVIIPSSLQTINVQNNMKEK